MGFLFLMIFLVGMYLFFYLLWRLSLESCFFVRFCMLGGRVILCFVSFFIFIIIEKNIDNYI